MHKRLVALTLITSLLLGTVPALPVAAATPRGRLVLPYAHDNGSLLTMNDDGTGVTYLPLFGAQPTWSPDGKKLAYRSYTSGSEGIYVADADGKNAHKVSTGGGGDRYPDWSPDGSRIAFTRDSEIWTAKPDGSGETRVIAKSANACANGTDSVGWSGAYDAAWSPDGTKFVLLGAFGCQGLGLYVTGTDGSGARRLDMPQVAYGGYELDPDWSPDGKSVAFFGREYQGSGYQGLWAVDAAGGTPRHIGVSATHPSWSPDSTEVVATGSYGIKAYKADGTSSRQLSEKTIANGDGPEWAGPPPAPKSGYAKFTATNLAFEGRLEELKKRVRPQRDALVSDRTTYVNMLAAEKKRLNEAGAKQEKLRKEMEDLRYRIDLYASAIKGPVTEAQQAGFGPYEEELKAANFEWRDVSLEIALASKTYADYERKLQEVERKLVAISGPLNTMDFDLDGISVRAEDRPLPVYNWRYTDQWSQLDKLDLQITFMSAEAAELKSLKEAAFEDFVRMTREATDKQIAIAAILKQHMVGKAGTATVKYGWDLYKAGVEGGLPGLVAELAKKLVESTIAYVTMTPVGDPNPGAKEVLAWYKGSVLDTLKQDAKDLAYEKTTWDPGADVAIKLPVTEAFLCKPLYQKLGETCDLTATKAKTVIGDHVVLRAKAARKVLDRLKLRVLALSSMASKKSYLEFARRSTKLFALKTFAKIQDLGPDLQEAALNRIMDERETSAWYEYNHLDQVARNQWGVYVATSNQYDKVKSDLDSLLSQKAELLAGWDKNTKQKTTARTRFKVPEQVIVEVRFTQRSGDIGAPLPIDVYVSGLKAEPGPTAPWGRKYYLTKDQLMSLTDAQREALVVELR